MDGWIWYMRDPKEGRLLHGAMEGACIRFSTLHECAYMYNAFSLHVVHYHSSSSALRRRIVEEGQRLLISLCPTDVMHRLKWNERERRVLLTRSCSSLEGSILAFSGQGLDLFFREIQAFCLSRPSP